MNKEQLIIGGVYATDIYSQLRVLAYDPIELFYDSWWEHKNDWGLNCHNGKVIFYRSGTSAFEKTAKLIRVDPLSETEQSKYKLNLPLRLCRHPQILWTQKIFTDFNHFTGYLEDHDIPLKQEPVLQTAQIVLEPMGPNGGFKKSSTIKADNGKWFTEPELLWKAFQIQSAYKTSITNGVGLYRSGLSKGLASYYIGGYHNLAGL